MQTSEKQNSTHPESEESAVDQFRDRVKDHPAWKTLVWLAGAADVTAMTSQFLKIYETRNVTGVSLAMFEIFLAIQLVFCFEAWCRRSTAMYVSLLIQAGATSAVIGEILYFRNQLPPSIP